MVKSILGNWLNFYFYCPCLVRIEVSLTLESCSYLIVEEYSNRALDPIGRAVGDSIRKITLSVV